MVSRPVSARRSGHCPSDRAVCGNKCAMQEKFAKGISAAGLARVCNGGLLCRFVHSARGIFEPVRLRLDFRAYRGIFCPAG